MPKSMTLGRGRPSASVTRTLRGLDVAVDDPFGVRVLDRVAHLGEELQPLLRPEAPLVAVLGDGNAGHVLHDEVGPPVVAGPRVEDLGDGRVVHEGQGLALGLEAGAARRASRGWAERA